MTTQLVNLMDARQPMDRRCKAQSKQSHEQCKRTAIRGGTVCKIHGGGSPQVRAKAEERLLAMVDPALSRLRDLIDTEVPGVALAAVKDVLDRTGYKPTERVETLSVNAFTLRIDRGDRDDG